MLHGIRRELQASLAAEGYNVRVYVPFGTEWCPYFMRRLAERPANLWFFLSDLLKGSYPLMLSLLLGESAERPAVEPPRVPFTKACGQDTRANKSASWQSREAR